MTILKANRPHTKALLNHMLFDLWVLSHQGQLFLHKHTINRCITYRISNISFWLKLKQRQLPNKKWENTKKTIINARICLDNPHKRLSVRNFKVLLQQITEHTLNSATPPRSQKGFRFLTNKCSCMIQEIQMNGIFSLQVLPNLKKSISQCLVL